jgi:hypothetical protein
MSSPATYTITPSLVDNPRQNLEAWTESAETHARSMCAMRDVTGALTLVLVLSDAKWDLMPANLTNPIDVVAGLPPVYRNRPAYAAPAAHANNTPSAAVNIHRIATTRHTDFIFASSNLTTALLASIGATNTDILLTTNQFSGLRAVHAHADADRGHHGNTA